MIRSLTSWREFLFEPDVPFSEKALAVFWNQVKRNPVYRRFCMEIAGADDLNSLNGMLQQRVSENRYADSIPLIPIRVFRDMSVCCDYTGQPDAVFRSSGTGGSPHSTHEIADLELYHESCLRGFSRHYDIHGLILLAWLPGYRDNPRSSLISMIDYLVGQDGTGASRFLPLDKMPVHRDFEVGTYYGYQELHSHEKDIPPGQKNTPQKNIMLFGAAFGLLDLIDSGSPQLPDGSIVVETGGMKTYRREISKPVLRQKLADGFGLPTEAIHSEYGMAEMCSQAWDTGTGWFHCPPWLRITIRNPGNPMQEQPAGEEGLIGVMDLANVHSLSFFLTDDRGVARNDGTFQVLGRWDHAELRGCNFLME